MVDDVGFSIRGTRPLAESYEMWTIATLETLSYAKFARLDGWRDAMQKETYDKEK